MVKASASRAENPGFESSFRRDFSGVKSYHWLKNWHSSGVIGSVLGLVSPVSVYCDWVKWKVWSATSISEWQHVKLSEQLRPWDTLACFWDVKQASNQLAGWPLECQFLRHWYESTRKNPVQVGFEPRIFRSRGGEISRGKKRLRRRRQIGGGGRWRRRRRDGRGGGGGGGRGGRRRGRRPR